MENGARVRVVVTGQGMISPIGNSIEDFWRNLTNGVSGIAPITLFDTTNMPVKFAGEVKDFDPDDYMDGKAAKRMARFSQFAVAAAQEAVRNANLRIDDSNADMVASIVGTGGGAVGDVADEGQVLFTKGPGRVSPFFLPRFIANMGASQVGIHLGAKGPTLCNAGACATGVISFNDALHVLRSGEADVALTGATEANIHPLQFAGFNNMGALSKRNDEPTRASRPFDKNRDGFVAGEGAGIMVLETLEHAIRRDAPIMAELLSAAVTGDAYHVSAPRPDGSGAALAMSRALKYAGLRPEDVDLIVAHGTSTPLNDSSETHAIKTVFGEHAYKLMVTGPKSMVGHQLGAAGSVSGALAVLAIRDGIVPPTINYDTPDPDCDLDYVPNVKREAKVRVAMVNGFAFGGQNASAIFKVFEQ